MIILRYNPEDYDIETTREIYHSLQAFDEKVIVLPQDWDILFNCSISDLYYFKEMIENVIHDKEAAEDIFK